MPSESGELFDFLEVDVARRSRPDEPSPVGGPLPRALELATSDWSEVEAGQELARLWGSADLRQAQSTLLATLQASPFTLVREILAARALWVAIDLTSTQ